MTKEILAHFQTSTSEFLEVAESIPSEKLHQVAVPGEWPASYVIHHLADSDAHFLVRFLNILSVDGPAIIPFDEASFPSALCYPGRSVGVSLTAIASSCAHAVDILSQLDEVSWNRTGFHAERGELSLSALLQLTTNHRLDHIDQLRKAI